MRRVKKFIWFIPLSLLFILSSSCSQKVPRQAIFILLDAARPDHFSNYGYEKLTTPAIDRLAERGAVFLNCFTQGTFTRSALPSMLYSRYYVPNVFPSNPFVPLYSPHELFRDLDQECISLPRTLEKNGFLTAAVSAHTSLKAKARFATEFMEFFDLVSIMETNDGDPYPSAEKVIDFSINWLKKNKDKDFFLYVHIMDTHFPHYFNDDAKAFFGKDDYPANRFKEGGWPIPDLEPNDEDINYIKALYDGSLRNTDRQLERLFGYLEASKTLDSTLIVISSDHGEFLLERSGRIGHGGKWYEQVARIPLIFFSPGKVGPMHITAFSEIVDIGPTIIAIMNAELPRGKAMDGVNLLGLTDELAPQKTAALIKNGGIRTERYKCMFSQPDSVLLSKQEPDIKKLSGELYDLSEDTQEKTNLFVDKPEVVQQHLHLYRDKMLPLFERSQKARTKQTPIFPFAVSSRSFKTKRKITNVSYRSSPEHLLQTNDQDGWFQSNHEDYYWLFAKPIAEPIKIEFSIPSGRYYLLVDMNGSCHLVIGDEDKLLRSKSFSRKLPWPIKQVEYGLIEVKNDRFSAEISLKSKRPWFGLRLLGFVPENLEDMQLPEYKRRRERLKALGYIK